MLVLEKFTIKVEKRRFTHQVLLCPMNSCSHAQQISVAYQIRKSKHIVESLGFSGDISALHSIGLDYLKRFFSQTILVEYRQEKAFQLFIDVVMHS